MKNQSLKNSSRRQFIQQSSALTGAFVIGMHLPLTSQAATGDVGKPALANAWVQIKPNNQITLICARSEMGQDVYTSLPALLAEELNLPLSMIRVLPDLPAPLIMVWHHDN